MQESVHGAPGGHVGADFLDGAQLGSCEGEGQAAVQLFDELAGLRVTQTGLGLLFGAAQGNA